MNSKIEKVKESFSVQAVNFENSNMNFSRQEYLDYIIKKIDAKKTDSVLEVAAGTCVCGRSLASGVASVTCLDATPKMLAVGKRAAEEKKSYEDINGPASVDSLVIIIAHGYGVALFPYVDFDECQSVVLSEFPFGYPLFPLFYLGISLLPVCYPPA